MFGRHKKIGIGIGPVYLVRGDVVMRELKNRWMSLVLGTALVGGITFYTLPARPALADEHRNPRIHHALDALRDARQELLDAPHDFHGQKQDALDAIQNAIDHLDRIKDW
jgi:hypothetical protein